ncbi:MAG: ATP-binding protein [Lachnospiraceae bacterium]|nr:ATP-binding protein [Lachnospiraceae bacterium]
MKDHGRFKAKEFEGLRKNLSEVVAFLTDTISEWGWDSRMFAEMPIAVEEIFVNIASYAYDRYAAYRPVWVECGEEDGELVLVFKDSGKKYDPLSHQDPEIDDPKKATVGGYGIYMVKQIADGVFYEYDEEKGLNILKLIKKR